MADFDSYKTGMQVPPDGVQLVYGLLSAKCGFCGNCQVSTLEVCILSFSSEMFPGI